MESTVCTASMVLRDIASKRVVSVPAQRSPYLRPKQLPGPPLACWTLTPFFQAVFATLSMMAAAITVRIHWRCAHVVQICLGDHHRLLSSSSWSTLATRMPGLVAIRVAVAAAVMNSRGSCHSGVALRVFFWVRVCAASERCVVPVSYTHLTLPTIYSV